MAPPTSDSEDEDYSETWKDLWRWKWRLGPEWSPHDWHEKLAQLRDMCKEHGDPPPFGLVPPSSPKEIVALLSGGAGWAAGKDYPLICVADESPLGLTAQSTLSCTWLVKRTDDTELDLGIRHRARVWDACPQGAKDQNGIRPANGRIYDAATGKTLHTNTTAVTSLLRLTKTPLESEGRLTRRIWSLQTRPVAGAPTVPDGRFFLYSLGYEGFGAQPRKWNVTLKCSPTTQAVYVRTRPSFLAKSAAKIKELGSVKMARMESVAQGSGSGSGGEADGAVDGAKLGSHLSGAALRHAWKRLRDTEGLARLGTGGRPSPTSEANTRRRKEKRLKSDGEGEDGENHEASGVMELMQGDLAVQNLRSSSHASQLSAFATDVLEKKDSLLSEEEQSESLGFPESEPKGTPESWVEEAHLASPFRLGSQGLVGAVSAKPGTAKIEKASFHASDHTLSCPLCEAEVPEEELETHLRKEIDYFPFRCSLCDCEFLDWPTAKAHFGGRFSLHRGIGPRLTEKRDAGKEQRLGELLDKAGL